MSKEKLFANSPIGLIEIPSWESEKLINLTDEELLLKAIRENKEFVISPATYAMIEKRQLSRALQRLINPNIGNRHDLPEWANTILLK